jgi:hypothetical protein
MRRAFALTFCFIFLIAVAGCGGDESAEPDAAPEAAERNSEGAPDAANDPASAITGALNDAFGGEGGRIETVDFRTLRDLLPEGLDGMERVDASGERAGVAGFSFSQAEGEYRSDDGERRVSLQIVDGGGLTQMTMLGATWMRMDFDRESTDGYERTTEFEGYPAYEKMRTGDRPRSELSFVVADRFLVTANGQNVEMDELKDAVGDIDLGALEGMRDEGVEK